VVDDQLLVRVDLATNRMTAAPLIDPSALQVGDGRLWAISPADVAPSPSTATLSRISLATGDVQKVARIPYGQHFAVGLGAVWVLNDGLMKIDPQDGRILSVFATTGIEVLVGCGSLWIWDLPSAVGSVLRHVDPESGRILGMLTLADDSKPTLIGTPDQCWLATRSGVQPVLDGTAGPMVPWGNRLTPVGDSLWGVLWSVVTGGYVRQIDPATGAASNYWRLPAQDLAVNAKGSADWRLLSAGGSLWLLNGAGLVRYDVSTALAP